jgi:N-acyl-D-amino-acid deacylase
MKNQLEQALDEGAIGMSSGLAYPPGSAVPHEELVALCQIVAHRSGVYTTHIRSESAGLLDALDEALETADRSGVHLHISHLKASGKANWHKLDAALEKVYRAGIGADRYPYTAGSTDLDILLPQWASYGGRDAILARLRDPQARQKIHTELMTKPCDYWDNVMIGSTQLEGFKGETLPDVAALLKKEPADAFLYLIEADELKTGGIFFSMSEENLWKVLVQPYVSLGSDASLRAPSGPLSADHPHPRAYGSHTKFLRAALDGKTVPLPEAIRKMTALPAAQFGLKKRGEIREGYFADIAIFDPAALRENTTYAQPHQLSSGLRHLVVNGIHTLKNGKQTVQRNGQFLSP